MTTISYSKKAFSNVFDIFNGSSAIGYLKFSNWNSEIKSYFNGKDYLFAKKGFWKFGFNVYEVDTQNLVADIEFSSWKQKAEINFEGQKYLLKNSNFWGTKWDLLDENKKLIEFQLTKQFWNEEGTIAYYTNDSEKMNLLAMTGLATINIFRRRAAAAAAA
jgi:hypothetical protein